MYFSNATIPSVEKLPLTVSKQVIPITRNGKLRHLKLFLALLLAISLLFAMDSAFAGWFTNLVAAVGIIAAIVAFAVPAAATVAAIVAVAAIAVLIVAVAVEVVGIVSIYASAVTTQQPLIVAVPEAPNPTPLSLILDPIPVPGNEADGLVNIVNNAIVAANTISDHAVTGVGDLNQDLAAFNAALAPSGAAYNSVMLSLGFPILTISQADIDSALADIASTGLPVLMNDALLDIGLTPGDIQIFTNNIQAVDVNLAVPTVSVSQALDAAAQLSVVPESSSLILLGTGLFGLLGYGWRRGGRAGSHPHVTVNGVRLD